MPRVEVMTEGRSVREVLAWSRSTVDPALRAAVDTLPSSMRRIAAYHFGWQDERGRPAEASAGKAIRPALVLLTAEAVGGVPASAVPAAVAVELVHNFSLLHDDVMDGDLTRRHRPTAWSVFGTGEAVLAGDALLTLALEVLAGSGHPAAREQLRMLSAAVLNLLDGQSADLAFEQRTDVGLTECLAMARGKTGALLGCACALGALSGGGCPEQVEQMRGFGEHLGLAFQFVDDLLGIWGDPAVTGKPVHSDLRTRKKSLPVVAALASGTPAGRELDALYHREQPPSGADLVRAAKLIDIAGGRDWSQARADDLLAQALCRLELCRLESTRAAARASAELEALSRLIILRDH
ncbi:MAG: polyprenyl synthetase family protein [Actinomycetota bacterium]|nr:polyprenyl synthetase family protein [Actinomycetota bacterium]